MNETQQGSSAAQTTAVRAGTPILVLKKLDKRFGATHALKAVDLTFEAGVKDCSRVRRKSSHGATTERRDHDERTNGQA